jgi:hypothetical protein
MFANKKAQWSAPVKKARISGCTAQKGDGVFFTANELSRIMVK